MPFTAQARRIIGLVLILATFASIHLARSQIPMSSGSYTQSFTTNLATGPTSTLTTNVAVSTLFFRVYRVP